MSLICLLSILNIGVAINENTLITELIQNVTIEIEKI
jgi:hypothetical protein